MKKTLLLSVLAGVSVASFAQSTNRATAPKVKSKYANIAVKAQKPSGNVDNMLPLENVSPVYSTPKRSAVAEEIIGTTGYHLQTNTATRNAIVKGSDGTIGAVWTTSAQLSAWSDRGTGYNYFDGSAWGTPGTRIEGATRVGWPNLAWPTNGSEVVATHSGAGGHTITRATKGTGAWGTSTLLDASVTTSVWARLVADGNTLHHIINGSGSSGAIAGQDGILYYSRSLDGGATWDKKSTVIPGSDSTYYLGWGGDAYAVAARDGHVAVVTGGLDVDVTLFKSDDNGNTWTKTIIWQFPIVKYNSSTTTTDINGDQVADTLDSNSGDVAVAIDHNGIAHVSYGGTRVLNDDPATGLSYFPGVARLYYWNQHMGANNAIDISGNAYLDFNNNQSLDVPSTGLSADQSPWGTYSGSGLLAHPSLGIDANNNIYLAYDAIAESADTSIFQQAFRHVFVMKSLDGGYTWSDFPTDVVPSTADGGDGEYQEAVWPSMAADVDGNVHIVYHRDPAPGIQNVSGTPREPDATNNASIIADVIYVAVPVGDINVGGKKAELAANSVSVFPNPAKAAALVNVNLAQAGKINVSVLNALGAEVMNANNTSAVAGMNSITLNTSALTAGVYFVKTNANGVVSTTKLIVE